MNGEQGELINGGSPKRRRKRQPDYIYEGLCLAVYGKPWQKVKGMDKGRAQKAAEELRVKGLDPLDCSVVEEIHRRAERWRQLKMHTQYKGVLDNPVLLAGDWRLCECKPTVQPGAPSSAEQAELLARYRADCAKAVAWWKTKPKEEQATLINQWQRQGRNVASAIVQAWQTRTE